MWEASASPDMANGSTACTARTGDAVNINVPFLLTRNTTGVSAYARGGAGPLYKMDRVGAALIGITG